MSERKRSRLPSGKGSRNRGAKFTSGEVKITVDYGYDIHSLLISGRTWNRIRRGIAIEVRGQGFFCEGQREEDSWYFHRSSRESVEISTDSGRDIYLGGLRDGNVWVDVDGQSVNLDEQLGAEAALDEALQRAYQSTEYRVPEEGLVLRVGVKCPEVAALHEKRGVSSSAFITAWNPQSKKLDGAANQRRNTLLASDLKALGLPFIDAEGVGADGWRELSYLVLGATGEQAQALGYTYGQNAFVFVDSSGVPELVMVGSYGDVTEMTVQRNQRITVAGFRPPPRDTPQEVIDLLSGDGEEAAFEHFNLSESWEELDSVGVVLIDGESPMNDARYAMLEGSPTAANLAAASLGASYRFRVE